MVSPEVLFRQLLAEAPANSASASRALALLGLPTEVQSAVDAGEIGPDTAYRLTKVEDPGQQAGLAREAARGSLKRDAVKARAAKPRKGKATARVTVEPTPHNQDAA